MAPASARALIALGDWHKIRGNWELAERAYWQALEVAPANVGGYLALGQLEEDRGNRAAAEELYRQATAVAPAVPDGYLSLGRLYDDIWHSRLNSKMENKLFEDS